MCHKTNKAQEWVRVWNVQTRKGRGSLDALWGKKKWVPDSKGRLLPTHSGPQKQRRTSERITKQRDWRQGVFVQSPSLVWLFMTPWTAACQASLSPTISWSLPESMSIESVMHSNNLIIYPFLLLPSIFPSIRVFAISQLFSSGDQSIGALASASVLPMSIQGWFPSVLTGLISLLSKGLSSVSSNTTWESINSLAFSLLYGPTFTSVYDYWKDHGFDYWDLCWRSSPSSEKAGFWVRRRIPSSKPSEFFEREYSCEMDIFKRIHGNKKRGHLVGWRGQSIPEPCRKVSCYTAP